jgi:hypothetical protein
MRSAVSNEVSDRGDGKEPGVAIQPFDETAISPLIAALPKADLHLHQEAPPRLQRIAARCQSELPYDWLSWAQRVFVELPPGMARLLGIYQPDASMLRSAVSDPELFIARIVDVLKGQPLMELYWRRCDSAPTRTS